MKRKNAVHQNPHGRLARQRPLDRGRHEQRMVLATGLHAAMAAGSKTELAWNDRQADRFVCQILDAKSRQGRMIPRADDPAPQDSGVFHIDLHTGESKLTISLADIARFGEIPNSIPTIVATKILTTSATSVPKSLLRLGMASNGRADSGDRSQETTPPIE